MYISNSNSEIKYCVMLRSYVYLFYNHFFAFVPDVFKAFKKSLGHVCLHWDCITPYSVVLGLTLATLQILAHLATTFAAWALRNCCCKSKLFINYYVDIVSFYYYYLYLFIWIIVLSEGHAPIVNINLCFILCSNSKCGI